MIISKNMLIPEVKVSQAPKFAGLSWAELGAILDRLDSSATCFMVVAVVRESKDNWHISFGALD